ncbi:hypothetical protein O988_04880 [Pseudogymnoascus sp. VKM F-3808]|nr:hypothetical protein O988_04880 [Pseudogymnoascus sp. VKM F-3808]
MAPTPESASFLAKKPTVPATFDGVDYDDTPRLKQAQDAILREQWVRSMMARLVREEMGKCYYREGVNHLEKCGALRERYFELLKESKKCREFWPTNEAKSMAKEGNDRVEGGVVVRAGILGPASALPLRVQHTFLRSLTGSTTSASPATPATATGPTISTPLPPKPKAKTALPVSAAPAGTVLKGLNYLKGRDDPVALAEEEYPEWLWKCLEVDKKGKAGDELEGDEFSKSKKTRRLVAKRQRKLEARLIASGDTEALLPKVPLQQQTIDLPSNEQGSVEGAVDAVAKRHELTKAMRSERRAKIKETNFLKGMN